MACEEHYSALMHGLEKLDFSGSPVPSAMVLTRDHAFPLALSPKGQVLIAASCYGQGRMVVLGHEQYLRDFPDLVENALSWLISSVEHTTTVGIHESCKDIAYNLSISGTNVKVGDFQSGFDVYVCDAYGVDQCAKQLVAFLKAGGGLLIAGQAWHWATIHPDKNAFLHFPGNKICSVAGIYLSTYYGEHGTFSVPKQIPTSYHSVLSSKDFVRDLEFLLKGVSEFDIQGEAVPSEVLVHGPLAFPIGTTPNGGAFIAGAYYGQGRVIVSTHEAYLGHEPLTTFMINAIHWLDEGHNGLVGVQPQLKGAYKLLKRSGLECQLTHFKEGLSVYVCTSYSDAQCDEIQDFVAEGGGLLIGGHAWHWAYTHRGHNVMTDYPGNHILNEMGLSILEDTLSSGLYKTPDVQQVSTKGYHFRKLLQRFIEHMTLSKTLTEHEQAFLKKLGSDYAKYLRIQAHDSASYTSVVTSLTEMLKKVDFPQVSDKRPVSSAKDHLLLHIGTQVYKVCSDPDTLLPYIIKNRPNLPTVSNARVCISVKTEDFKEWISTGLYLSPGMKTYIEIPPEIIGKDWQVQIGCQSDDLGKAEVLKRAPVVCELFPVNAEKIHVCNLWGGLIYLIAPPKSQVKGMEIIIKTAIQAPYYKSDETTVKDWVNNIRNAPAPWAELEFENIILTMDSDIIRQLERPDKVATLWDNIMKGVADLAAKPAKFPRKERFVADVQISAGFLHSGYPIMMHTESAWDLMGPMKDMWGPIHELGHNQQRSVWEFRPHTTECTCNIWSVYIHETVLQISREQAHEEMTSARRLRRIQSYVKGGQNLKEWEVWTALETYMQLQEKFGWDAFKTVFAAYHHMKDVPDHKEGKMNVYTETFSKVVNMNLAPFFKAWGWPIEPSTEERLSSLPVWSDHPMAQYI
ncbi:TRPM8 channel-associated factor homolog [Chanos chanos]|uniref:TRPM8 channel-associated factor homolog n=1 Tax=Chanos chanos TaxID=29144 RepID=A0A6J2VPF8_CHACN|nr:TRPM8 channel-associated factor homolog [Chanos chanos]